MYFLFSQKEFWGLSWVTRTIRTTKKRDNRRVTVVSLQLYKRETNRLDYIVMRCHKLCTDFMQFYKFSIKTFILQF